MTVWILTDEQLDDSVVFGLFETAEGAQRRAEGVSEKTLEWGPRGKAGGLTAKQDFGYWTVVEHEVEK